MTARDTLSEAVARMTRFTTELGMPCALIGGVAVIARVFVRATKDIDLLVSCPAEEARVVLDVARRHGYGWEEADVADFLAAGLLRMWGPPSRPPSQDDSPGVEPISAARRAGGGMLCVC